MDCFVASLLAMTANAPYPNRHRPRKAGDPVFRAVSDGAVNPRRTRSSAFAEHDGRNLFWLFEKLNWAECEALFSLHETRAPCPDLIRESINFRKRPCSDDGS